ncbi:MAG TPA: hypothetical protein PLK67_02765 [Bryobacteraceae bacterium]|nr:hypothetical protein [Bryobacteraceae bacterium]
MISSNDLELSGIVKSRSAVHLIVCSAREIPAGARIAVPFIGERCSAHVQECVPYRDRFLLWLELAECLGA